MDKPKNPIQDENQFISENEYKKFWEIFNQLYSQTMKMLPEGFEKQMTLWDLTKVGTCVKLQWDMIPRMEIKKPQIKATTNEEIRN